MWCYDVCVKMNTNLLLPLSIFWYGWHHFHFHLKRFPHLIKIHHLSETDFIYLPIYIYSFHLHAYLFALFIYLAAQDPCYARGIAYIINLNHPFYGSHLEDLELGKQEGGKDEGLLDMIIEMKMAYLEHGILVHGFMVGNWFISYLSSDSLREK